MHTRMFIVAGGLAALAAPAAWSQQDNAEIEAIQREAAAVAQEAEASAAIQAQVEASRADMEAARVQLERAAREVALQAQRITVDENGVTSFRGQAGTPFLLSAFGARAQMGASLIDAEGGALVTEVAPESGAATAGLKVGDVIKSIDGVELSAVETEPAAQVINRLMAIEPGATVELVVEREGAEVDVNVVTQDGPTPFLFNSGNGQQFYLRTERLARDGERAAGRGAAAAATRPLIVNPDGGSLDVIRLFNLAGEPWGDMELVAITPELGRYFETTEGLLVVRAPSDDSIALQDGDVILSIGGRTPTSPEHAIRILGSFEPGEVIEFSLMRDGRPQPIQYTVEERSGDAYFFSAPGGSLRVAPPAAAAPPAPGATGARSRGPAAPATATPPAPVSPTSP